MELRLYLRLDSPQSPILILVLKLDITQRGHQVLVQILPQSPILYSEPKQRKKPECLSSSPDSPQSPIL
jgi:hypothetical protein